MGNYSPPLHAPPLSVTPAVAANAALIARTLPTIRHTVCLAGVWGEASPQAPPEARWAVGRSRGASQPWAGGRDESEERAGGKEKAGDAMRQRGAGWHISCA